MPFKTRSDPASQTLPPAGAGDPGVVGDEIGKYVMRHSPRASAASPPVRPTSTRIALVAIVAVSFLLLLQAATGRVEAFPTGHPTLTTAAPATSPVGSPITDSAALSGGTSPVGGTITFSIFGPADPTCARSPTSVGAVTVSGDGLYSSPPFTPTTVGVYHFQASYSGNAFNQAVAAPSACFTVGEQTVAVAARPSLTTNASATVPTGGTITDTATLAGGYNPSGTITFTLYGPANPGCSGTPVFSSTKPVGSPTVSSAYTPAEGGVYDWVATYSGDADNLAVTGACGDPNEAVTASAPSPSVTAIVVPGGQSTLGPAQRGCAPPQMAQALTKSIAAALTGQPGSAFKATCRGGVRIVLRAREIRPGFLGTPKHNGYTTIGDTLTIVPASGQIAFSINAQGIALRRYAKSTGASLLVFAIVHVKPSDAQPDAESIRVFALR